MNNLLLTLALFFSFSAVARESINFHPGINLNPISEEMTDLHGHQGNQLCGPVSLTYAFNFLKYTRTPRFSELGAIPDMNSDGLADTINDQIRYFFSTCKTHRLTGTFTQNALICIRDYMRSSGYNSWSNIIGLTAVDAHLKTPVTVNHMRNFLTAKAAVVMSIGWYVKNSRTGKYERAGGHYLNVFGYDYEPAWKQNKIILKVVNPGVDYSRRPPSMMYDDVVMDLVGDKQLYPYDVYYKLSGLSLSSSKANAVIEDIIVFLPR